MVQLLMHIARVDNIELVGADPQWPETSGDDWCGEHKRSTKRKLRNPWSPKGAP